MTKCAEATSIFIRLVNGKIRESVNVKVAARAMASFRYTTYIPQFIRARCLDYNDPGVSKRVGSITLCRFRGSRELRETSWDSPRHINTLGIAE